MNTYSFYYLTKTIFKNNNSKLILKDSEVLLSWSPTSEDPVDDQRFVSVDRTFSSFQSKTHSSSSFLQHYMNWSSLLLHCNTQTYTPDSVFLYIKCFGANIISSISIIEFLTHLNISAPRSYSSTPPPFPPPQISC